MSFSIIAAEGTEEKFAWIAHYIKGKERVIVYSDKNKELAEYLGSMGISCIDVSKVKCEQELDFLTETLRCLLSMEKHIIQQMIMCLNMQNI